MTLRNWLMLAAALSASGCEAGTGIVPVGPDTYSLSEMRAPVRGGGMEARRAVLAEADEFCRAQGRVFVPLEMQPDGDPRTPYFPTAFDATFRCARGTGSGADPGVLAR